MLRLLFIALICLVVASCNNKGTQKETQNDTLIKPDSLVNPLQIDDPTRDSILLAMTSEVLTAFKNKHYDSLSLFVHPDEGVRFSPYAFIDTTADQVISAQVVKSWADPKNRVKILWGTTDPTDDPISLTIDGYVKRYVYDVDFVKPDSIRVNGFIGGGNTINNLAEIYKDCSFVESHFPGFQKKFNGMDWRSLRLVFKQKDDKFYLVGVVHDEWSI